MSILFSFKALDAQQQIVTGKMQVPDREVLAQQLQQQGLDLLSARRLHSAASGKPSRRDLIDFCFHVEHLLNAGIPLIDALQDLAQGSDSRNLRQLSTRLAAAVIGGKSLSAALQSEVGDTEPALVGIIRAGELSGRLPDILHRLGNNLRQSEALAAGTRQLLLYPAVAGGLVMAASAFLMIFLVPQIRSFLGESGLPLPLHTRLLFVVSDFLTGYWPYVIGTPPLLLLLGAGALRYRPALRLRLDRLALNAPLTGRVSRRLAVARLADLLALLYSTGIPLLEALEAVQKSCSNRVVGQALQRIRHAVEQGSSLAEAFARHDIFPPLLVRMLQIGEKTGGLDKALNNIAQRYEREARETITILQTLLEPALTLCIGILLGWIMLATMQPIYGIIGQVSP